MLDSIKAWARKHKKCIIITCSLVTVVGTAVILIINGKKVTVPVEEIVEDVLAEVPKTSLLPPTSESTAAIESSIVTTFPRSEFIRQLPVGQHASPAKLAQAAEMGIELKPGETIVNESIVHLTRAA